MRGFQTGTRETRPLSDRRSERAPADHMVRVRPNRLRSPRSLLSRRTSPQRHRRRRSARDGGLPNSNAGRAERLGDQVAELVVRHDGDSDLDAQLTAVVAARSAAQRGRAARVCGMRWRVRLMQRVRATGDGDRRALPQPLVAKGGTVGTGPPNFICNAGHDR